MERRDAAVRFDWRIAALIAGAVCIAYLPSLSNGFVWDDDRFLTDNPLIHAADGLRRFWLSTEAPDYFPLTSTTLWIEWRLWGMRAAGYHATNILLHAGSSLLLWRIFLRLRHPAAVLAALLFALHPVAAESVAWITERKNTLCMFFAAASTLSFLRAADGGSPRDRILAIGAFVLALLAKTAVVALPFVLLLLQWHRTGRLSRRDIAEAAPYFGVSLVLGLVTVWFQYNVNIATDVVRTDTLPRRIQTAGWAVWFYLAKSIAPVGLSFVYPMPSLPHGLAGWLPLGALAAAGGIVVKLREPLRSALGAALGSFVALLLPVLGVLDIYFMRYALVSDHWAYFALAAPCALVALGVHAAALRFAMPQVAAASVLCIALGVLTLREQPQYRDAETLWRSTIARNPQAWIALNNLGSIESGRGNRAEALRLFAEAVEARPDYREARYNLANALRDAGDADGALLHYDEAVRLDPNFAAAWNNAGNLLLSLGRAGDALERLRRASELLPDDAAIPANLGAALLATGSPDEARAVFEDALLTDPANVSVLVNYGGHLASVNELEAAARLFARAVEADPSNVEARFNLASVHHLRGDLEAAIRGYGEALELAPGEPRIRRYLDEAVAEASARESSQ